MTIFIKKTEMKKKVNIKSDEKDYSLQDDVQRQIGEAIRSERMKQKISPATLGKKANSKMSIDRKTIERIEKGGNVRIGTLVNILDALNLEMCLMNFIKIARAKKRNKKISSILKIK
jgi:transcriptional regulator with XRE-family HTH domain